MNLELYNFFKTVPVEAQKLIGGGRLKGMTDINPMWRIKVLTEKFGACGIGWKYEVLKREIIDGANDEKAAFVDINLYYKNNGEWSEPVHGTGGSMFVTKESRGLYTSDECFKMALTDALSVACKALGVAADIYYSKDRTKYTGNVEEKKEDVKPKNNTDLISESQVKRFYVLAKGKDIAEISSLLKEKGYAKADQIKKVDYQGLCKKIEAM